MHRRQYEFGGNQWSKQNLLTESFHQQEINSLFASEVEVLRSSLSNIMVNLNPLLVSFALKAVATMLAGIVMGSSFYVLWVECPARLTQDMATAVKLWKEFFQRAKKSQVIDFKSLLTKDSWQWKPL